MELKKIATGAGAIAIALAAIFAPGGDTSPDQRPAIEPIKPSIVHSLDNLPSEDISQTRDGETVLSWEISKIYIDYEREEMLVRLALYTDDSEEPAEIRAIKLPIIGLDIDPVEEVVNDIVE